MFAPASPSWTARLRRAAALVKAFALLEDGPRSAPPPPAATADDRLPRAVADLPPHVLHAHEQRTHPHRLPLAVDRPPRRPGAVPARPAPCTMPVTRRVDQPRTAHADR